MNEEMQEAFAAEARKEAARAGGDASRVRWDRMPNVTIGDLMQEMCTRYAYGLHQRADKLIEEAQELKAETVKLNEVTYDDERPFGDLISCVDATELELADVVAVALHMVYQFESLYVSECAGMTHAERLLCYLDRLAKIAVTKMYIRDEDPLFGHDLDKMGITRKDNDC